MEALKFWGSITSVHDRLFTICALACLRRALACEGVGMESHYQQVVAATEAGYRRMLT